MDFLGVSSEMPEIPPTPQTGESRSHETMKNSETDAHTAVDCVSTVRQTHTVDCLSTTGLCLRPVSLLGGFCIFFWNYIFLMLFF